MASRRGGLRVSADLTLPIDSATKTFAILAQRRKGKTYTANVTAEEMVAAGQPWVALDPTSAWWGLRASADGKKEGLPVVIIGGEHGDVPLERGAGAVIADLVVDEPGWYVIDLGHLESKAAEREFATAFADRFYRRKAKSTDPVHLFVDEADMFVPQRPQKGDERMLGAFEAIVRRGGIRGIGTTLISQRPAVVNKNVLEQIDVLIVLRVVGPNDQKAIMTYVDAQGTDEEKKALKDSMASLKLGEAWIWEPGAEPPLFERVQIRKRETFNSSATPKSGERKSEPKKLADVDLEKLKGQIADTIERAKADDPKTLKKEIATLKRDMAKAEKAGTPAPPPEPEIQPVFPAELQESLVLMLEVLDREVEKTSSEIRKTIADTIDTVKNTDAETLGRLIGRRRGGAAKDHGSPPRRSGARQDRSSVPRAAAASPAPAASVAAEPLGDVSSAQQNILNALAALEAIGVEQPSKVQLALFANVSPKSSGYQNNLGALRSAGLVSYPVKGTAALTPEGRSQAVDADAPDTVEDLHENVRALVGPSKWAILEVLIGVYPDALTKDDLADAAGASPRSSGYQNNLGSLRSLGLIDYPAPGEAAATPILFLEAS